MAGILPAQSERELRQLRFKDPQMEQAFRHSYAQRSRIHLRVVMGLTLIIPTLGLVATLLQVLQGSAPAGALHVWFWFFQTLPVLVHLGAFLLTWSARFPRLFQPYMALVCLVVGTTLMAAMLPAPEAIQALLVASLYTYTLFRLRFLAAVLVYWTLVAFYFGYSAGVLHTPLSTLVASLPGIIIANLLGMLAAYTLEHWSRREFLLTRRLEEEQEKSERLLRNILPGAIADRLKEQPGTVADSFAEVTVLFSDIVDFTPLSARLSAEETVKLLNGVFSCFDLLAEKHGLEKIKTIGDAYMVVGGLPEPREDHAEAVLAIAMDMQREIARFRTHDGAPLGLRIGINTGPVVAGVIGTKKFIYDLWGDTVNLASRMESHGVAGGIQVTPAVYDRLRTRYAFTARPLAHVKGKGAMTAYLLNTRANES